MFKRTDNIAHRLLNRQTFKPAPNTHIHKARQLYENIVPNFTVYDVECPDHIFYKFSNDGQYLISFSRNQQDLIVYRHKWLNYCVNGETCDAQQELPLKAKKFESYFSQLYTLNLANGIEMVCKDFFISTECCSFGIFATSTAPDNDVPATSGASQGVPSIAKTTFYLVRLSDGVITDTRIFQDDCIQLTHNAGVFMYEDLLAVLSIRYQNIHILQVRETGKFVDVRSIGTHCREDDELILSSHTHVDELILGYPEGNDMLGSRCSKSNQNNEKLCEASSSRMQGGHAIAHSFENLSRIESARASQVSASGSSDNLLEVQPIGRVSRSNGEMNGVASGITLPNVSESSNSEEAQEVHLLGGMKQRLLSFIFRGIWNQEMDPSSKAMLLKRFYFNFQHYSDLLMWKVQFLDRSHLLIKFGNVDCVVNRNSEASNMTSFLAVYNIESTKVLGFYQNSSKELSKLYEQFCDHFQVAPRFPLYMRFVSSNSNNCLDRDHLQRQRAISNSNKNAQLVKRMLASLPYCCQSQSPSPYFDQSLFHFDEKLISATIGHRTCVDHPIKFISKHKPNALKFKINPGLEVGAGDGRVKRVASFIFHPTLPFAMSIRQSYMQPTVLNFHFRR